MIRAFALLVLAALAVVATQIAGTTQAYAEGQVLFRSDFETGDFGNWYLQSLPNRASILPGGEGNGTYAARFEVRGGDSEPDTGSERSEVSGPTFDEGQDLFIRDEIMVPSQTRSLWGLPALFTPWQIVQQLHERDWTGPPGLALFLGPGPTLELAAGDGSPSFWRSSPLENDQWYELVYRVRLSRLPRVGFVEVWLDGQRQKSATGKRFHGQTIQADQAYLKAGIYRSSDSIGTSVIYHDNIVVGTDRQAILASPLP